MHSIKLFFGKKQEDTTLDTSAKSQQETPFEKRPFTVLDDAEMLKINGGKSKSFVSVFNWNSSLGGQMPQ